MTQSTIDPVENANPYIGARPTGTVIRIAVEDEDVGLVLDAKFDRLVVERSVDNIVFNEVTTPSDRPVLVRTQTGYVWTDRAGSPGYYYRTRYFSSMRNELTPPSPSIAGAGLAIRNILTVAELKSRYFFGVNLTDGAGHTYSDAAFQHFILQAIRWLERQIDVPILPTTFVERHDYYREDWTAFQYVQLDNYPVISVESFNVQYPSGQNVVVFPDEWLRIDKNVGVIQVVPTSGTLSDMLVGQGGSYLPAIYNGMHYLPGLYEVQYTAGFAPGLVPRDIIDVLGMFASLGPFNVFGDLIAGAGIATLSLSMDGLSQSIGTTSSATNSGYGSRIIQYLKQIDKQIPVIRKYYKRIGGMSVA